MAVVADEVPGVHPGPVVERSQKAARLVGLKREGREAQAPVPGQDLADRPATEAAVGVVDQQRAPLAGRTYGTAPRAAVVGRPGRE